jgi:hypothetical protein
LDFIPPAGASVAAGGSVAAGSDGSSVAAGAGGCVAGAPPPQAARIMPVRTKFSKANNLRMFFFFLTKFEVLVEPYHIFSDEYCLMQHHLLSSQLLVIKTICKNKDNICICLFNEIEVNKQITGVGVTSYARQIEGEDDTTGCSGQPVVIKARRKI